MRVNPKLELSQESQEILQCFAAGMEYNHVCIRMANKYNWTGNYQRMLGTKMSMLKQDLNCKTQFQMGYIFAQERVDEFCDQLNKDNDRGVAIIVNNVKLKTKHECWNKALWGYAILIALFLIMLYIK